MAYIVGVSSGIFGAASTEERMQGISVGLYKKAQFCITKGVEFVQIDLESISEFKEPNLKENMERLERMGITFGIHSEVAAFGGREFPHLDSAIDIDYQRGHTRLITVLKETGELGTKFVLIHSSESTPFLLLGRELQPAALVDYWGRPLKKIILEQTEGVESKYEAKEKDIVRDRETKKWNNWLWGWIRKKENDYLWLDLVGENPDEIIKRNKELRTLELKQTRQLHYSREYDENVIGKKIEEYIHELAKVENEIQTIKDPFRQTALHKKKLELEDEIRKETNKLSMIRNLQPEKIEEEIAKESELSERERHLAEEQIEENLEESLKDRFFKEIESKSLRYGPERHAYFIVAKTMEHENDPLWNNIIETSIKYYATVESKVRGKKVTEEEWLKERGIEKVDGKWSIENDNFRLAYQLWVPAVSAKYVWGHFNQDKCPDPKSKGRYEDPKEIIKKYKDKNKEFVFTLETPMASPGIEEHLRFPNPLQIYELCKEVGLDIMQLAIDIEHMLMSNQDPQVTFDLMPDDAGKYVRVVHAGWPSPLGPAHIPVQLGSEQHRYLYEMYYMLRQKGFGKDKSDYYLVFERGGGADPIQQSIIALRLITKFLELNTKPEDLPNEFYGIEAGQIASVERQWVAIEEHGRDPLKGLITVPEEEYTFLGRAALEKGKRPEEWKKEELR